MERDFPLYDIQLARLRDFSREQRLRRLIHFRLESDSIPVRASPTDLWIPKFRKYGSTPDGNAQHLDETSMWRNLSPAQAKELGFWEDMFAAVMEYRISNHLIDIIDEMGVDERSAARQPDALGRHICEIINSMGCRTYPVNIQEVITSMIELYKRHGSQHYWLASSGDFHNGLCEFLRTRDCFLDTPLTPTVKVSFSASMNDLGEPKVCGRMKRYGPHVSFTRLDSHAFLDRSCHVHPVYVDSILDPKYDARVDSPEYRLKSDCVAFEWNSLQEGFVGFLQSGRVKPSTQPIPKLLDLTAIGTRDFPEGVKFERTIRLKINITVYHEQPLPEPPSYESLQTSSYEQIGSDLLTEYQRRRQSPAFPIDDLSSLMKTAKRGCEPAVIRGGAFGANAQCQMMTSPSSLPASSTQFEQNHVRVITNDVDSCRPDYWVPDNEERLTWQQQLFQWQRRFEKKPALRKSSSESRIKTVPVESSNFAFESSQDSSNATVCYSGSSKAAEQKRGKMDHNEELPFSDALIWAEIQKQANRVEHINVLVESALQPPTDAGGLKRPLSSDARGRRRSQSCGPPLCDEKRLKSDDSDLGTVAVSTGLDHTAYDPLLEHPILSVPNASGQSLPFRSKSGRERKRLSRRDDSLYSESSQVTAIQTHEKTADEMQAEIKEFYDMMLLKRQVEQSVAFRRQRVGAKSDEEAFEDAFREAGTDMEDCDAEE